MGKAYRHTITEVSKLTQCPFLKAVTPSFPIGNQLILHSLKLFLGKEVWSQSRGSKGCLESLLNKAL